VIRLTLQHGKRPIMFMNVDAIHPARQGGTSILIHGVSYDVIEDFETVCKLWHDYCYTSNTVVVGNYNLNSNNNNSNNSRPEPTTNKRQWFVYEGKEIDIDPTTDQRMVNTFLTDESIRDVVGLYMERFKATQGQYPTMIPKQDVGVFARVCKQNLYDQAKLILTWLFDSDHPRATWLRNKGTINPAVVLRSQSFAEYLSYAQMKPTTNQTKPTTRRRRQYDENGNRI